MLHDYIATALVSQRRQALEASAEHRGHAVEARAGRDRRPAQRSGAAAVFAATAAGGLLVSLDVSIANALLPAISADFGGTGRAALSWVITGYAIVFAAALVPAGRVADRVGRRRTYVGGLLVFAAGSLVCGVAPGLGVLLLGRVVQGLGAAAASPASLGLLLATVDARHRSVQAARWTGAAAVGVCLGPLLGGALTSLGDWRWAFLVNVPLVAVVAIAARRMLPETPRHPGRVLPDPLGAALFAAAAATASLALAQSATWGALSVRSVAVLATAALLAWAFVRRSGRVAAPLLQLTLLRNRRVAAAAVVTGCYAAAFFGFLLTFMIFAVGQWQLSLVGAGACALVPGSVVVLLTLHVGHLAERVGHRLTLAVGAGLMAAALLACAALLGSDHLQARWLVIGSVLGLGIGLCYPVLAGAAVHGLDPADLAAGSALNQCARQLGAAVGIAAAVGVLGAAPSPELARLHAAWVLAAAFCLAAVVAAALIPPIARALPPVVAPRSAAPTPSLRRAA
ncbi:MFS transporter [Nocardioides sp.]|uniref:MFS transporter n=1 Tax=Nocardioides sp. TaxID=35761 RepID=UPI0037837C52